MEIIYNERNNIKSILGKQKPSSDYRMMNFVVQDDTDDGGLVLYNNFTKSAWVLNKSEKDALENLDTDHPTIKKLIEGWYLVPKNFDELKTFQQVRDIYNVVYENSNIDTGLTSFTILTTTECNARCYYCYENGCEKATMDKQMAFDVANFIKKSSKDKKNIHLAWFGGEPLFNYEAIDIICNELSRDGYDYTSSMITNGYMFDEKLIKQAVNLWNLKSLQITLDGTRDVYNNAKSYAVLDENDTRDPFSRVLDNIDLLIKAKIKVLIRLNLSPENEEDIKDLIEILSKRFANNKYVHVYCHTLFQEISKVGTKRAMSDKSLEECYDRELEIQNLLFNKHLASADALPRSIKMNHCMADSKQSVVILPDGNLTKCEHFTEALPTWGSIYSNDYNQDIIKEWERLYPYKEECRTCKHCPSCLRLANCPNIVEECSSEYRNKEEKLLHKQLRYTYDFWKKRGRKVLKQDKELQQAKSD
ncbi:MAG: radical SAM protein [Coriobacteriia bacterium]|nr:radical SAM protein [Coriobacteriia bacterium]